MDKDETKASLLDLESKLILLKLEILSIHKELLHEEYSLLQLKLREFKTTVNDTKSEIRDVQL